MTKYIFNICSLVALLFLVSCKKDSVEFIPDASVNISGNDIFGVVIDEEDNAVEGARVIFDGKTVLTDEYGIYQFKDVSLNSRHNHLNITKEGYFEGARTFRTNKKTSIQHTTQLLRKNFTNNFNAEAGGTVVQGNIELEFPQGAVVVESSGADYTGTVRVAIQYLDPTNDNIVRRMPGDMSATNAEEIYSTLTSFGMAYVEMQSNAGEKLQLKEGMTATMKGRIPAAILNDAPASIKMWVFDDASGLWKEEGIAQKSGSHYVGEVAHFSCWNYDGDAETIIACGRVVDEKGNPLGGVHVWIATEDFFAVGHGNTNPNGTFCGAVTKGEILTLEIRTIAGCDEPIHLGQIGPFEMDVDLGDIAITVENAQNISVSGTAINCDGDPLTNGVLLFHNQSYQITDGTFEVSIINCNPNQDFKLKVIDLDDYVESEDLVVTGVGPHELGEVSACGIEINLMEMNIDDLDINYVGLQELAALQSDSINVGGDVMKTLRGFYSASNQNDGGNLNMTYDDMNEMSFSTGTFVLSTLYFNNWGNGTEDEYFLNSGQVVITQYNELEKYLKGEYTAQITSQLTGNEHTLYGKFKLPTF